MQNSQSAVSEKGGQLTGGRAHDQVMYGEAAARLDMDAATRIPVVTLS